MSADIDQNHVDSFDITEANLATNPDLAEALTLNGRLGTIREMNHEVREGQRIFIFLVDFNE
ncbi:hypothetical protein ACFOYW_06110 [Gryllotalpicola reticulitermitis]|uniref:Uncharacterized protein n=1 Tax=Gryllotalpicola reticulitermitis TaxID=1184153 RepID=A0ABV8Q5R8_9MICO